MSKSSNKKRLKQLLNWISNELKAGEVLKELKIKTVNTLNLIH